MPKDATKNVDRYKVRGGELNEFDFHQNQEAYAEQQKGQQAGNLIPGTPPEAKKAAKGTKAATKSTKEKTNKGASPKKAGKTTKSTKATKSTKKKKAAKKK